MAYNRQHSSRGSALLAVLCFTSVLALGVTSYITLCYRSLELSSRSFQHERAWQLAEAGLEQALWALNHDSLATGFDGWTPVGPDAERTFIHDLEGAVTAAVLVRVEDISSTSVPRPITVTSSVTLSNGTVLTRQLQCTANLLPTFINAIAGINSVDFGSNTPVIDSYRSVIGLYGGSNVGYVGVIAGDRLEIHKAQVKGYLTARINAKTLKPDIDHHDSATLKGPGTDSDVNIDPLRIGSHVNQPLPDIKIPTGGTPLPTATVTIGESGAEAPAVYYVANNLSLGNNVITIRGPVQLRVPGNIHMLTPAFTGKFMIEDGGSLELFVGNVFHVPYISFSPFFLGSINDFFENKTEDPKALVIYGTHSTGSPTTDFTIRDSSDHFYGTLYFPNSDLRIRGNGHIYGSIVAKTVELLGNTKIHYDASLRHPKFRGLKVPYAVDDVREVIASN